jgi:hypothetical protein
MRIEIDVNYFRRHLGDMISDAGIVQAIQHQIGEIVHKHKEAASREIAEWCVTTFARNNPHLDATKIVIVTDDQVLAQ